jgi:hypothetical protein
MANQAQTSEQINAVRQHIAQTIQNGGLEAYKGIPILNDLNGKLQSLQSADQMKAGLLPQKPPIAQQVLAQATQPQQPMQPEPMPTENRSSGVNELPSRLPIEMAEGGIVGYASGGDVKHFQVGGLGIADLLAGFSPSELGALDQEKDVEARRNVNRASGAKIPSIENVRVRQPIPNINAMGAKTPTQFPGISAPPAPVAAAPAASSEVTSPAQRIASAFRNSELFSNMFGKPTLASAAVPAAVGVGGGILSNLAAKNLQNNPAMLEAYSTFGDPGSDTSLAASIIDATKDNPTTPSSTVKPTEAPKKEEKEIKKVAGSPTISNSIKKQVADKIVKEEVGPSKDLMTAETTTPKEDALSKYEQMLTQSPEARQKEKDLDFYTRLFQAGIGVASGSSRNALENLKEAQPAIAGFASDIAKQREEDRSRIKDLAALGLKREEFGMELKKLGLTEKQIDSVSKHYADWNRHMQAQEKLEERKIGVLAANSGNAMDARMNLAQERNITSLINKYMGSPEGMGKTPAQLRGMAMEALGLTGGNAGTPTLSYSDFAKSLNSKG